MAKQKLNVTWMEIDTGTLKSQSKTALAKYRAASKAAAEAKVAFENTFTQKELQSLYDAITAQGGETAGTSPLFSMAFGLVKVAFGPAKSQGGSKASAFRFK